MRVTVLGCWAPYPRAGGACSGYLLQNEAVNLLIDCGNGVMSNLQKHLDFRLLDGVIISHLHPDHYLDLFCLRHAIEGAIREGSRKGPVPLYVPASPEAEFQQLVRLSDAFEVIPITPDKRVQIGSWSVSFLETVHKLEAYGVRVQGEADFGYTADTGHSPSLVNFFGECDLLISEASVMEKDREYAQTGHLTVAQAATLGVDARVDRLVLTHFWPEYNLEALKAEAAAIFPEVELAEEGALYCLDNQIRRGTL